jgi:hypothetical protein
MCFDGVVVVVDVVEPEVVEQAASRAAAAHPATV